MHRHSHLGTVFPSELSRLSKDEVEDLEAKFCVWQSVVNLSCIPSGLALAFLLHWLLTSTNSWFIGHDGTNGLKIPYQPIIWWFLPLFGTFTLCFEITLQVWSLFIGRKIVGIYSDWDSRQPKFYRGSTVYFDSRLTLRWLAPIVCIPVAVLSSLALDVHTSFANDGIYEFSFSFAKPVFHSYAELRRVAIVTGYYSGRNQRWIGRESFVLDFKDGHRWEQSDLDPDGESENLDALQEFIRGKTNLSITYANTVQALDGQ